MKHLFIFLLFFIFTTIAYAQIKAVTNMGDEVILYEDNTWAYAAPDTTTTDTIAVNPMVFTKSEKADFLLKSENGNIGIWLNPKEWRFEKSKLNPEAEYQLSYKAGDLYTLVFVEEISIPLPVLGDAVIQNIKAVASEFKLVHEEYRTVNGLDVLQLEFDAKVQGMHFTYFGYYFSNEKGTTQLMSYTSEDLFEKYRDKCEELLNGLTEIE